MLRASPTEGPRARGVPVPEGRGFARREGFGRASHHDTNDLLGVLDRARLAYDRHFDLTWVLQRLLDLLRDVA